MLITGKGVEMNKEDIRSDGRTVKSVPKAPAPKLRSRSVSIQPAAGRQPAPQTDAKTEFRKRLIARLDQAEVPVHKRMMYVAALTGRAVQTVSRWFDADRPGLPDLESYVRLCEGLHCNADWMLGRSVTPSLAPESHGGAGDEKIKWMVDLLDELRGDLHDCEPMRMAGDEMAPRIRDGDYMFVRRGTEKLQGNGIYVIEWNDRRVVRKVEHCIGKGVVLSCENLQYAQCVVKDAAAARRLSLRVVGKVTGIIRAVHFWAH